MAKEMQILFSPTIWICNMLFTQAFIFVMFGKQIRISNNE